MDAFFPGDNGNVVKWVSINYQQISALPDFYCANLVL
jgi:hypothetical protein